MHNTIYINARFLTQKLSGVQRYAFELSKELYLYNNYNFILLIPSKAIVRKDYNFSFNIKKIGNNLGHLWEQIDLPFYLNKKKKPLLISFTNSAPIFYNNKVTTIHDLSIFENKKWFSFRYRFFYRFLFPRIISTSKKVLTDSSFSKKEIIKKYKVNAEKISIIYCASTLNRVKKNNIDKLENYILFVGGSSKRKNLKNLINAFIKIDDKNIKLKVVVSNNSNLGLDKINKHKNIDYLSNVTNNELVNLYSNARMLIFCSFYEGFGMPPLEAMSFKCPVIISNIPVLKEVYGYSGLYINPYDVDDIAKKINILNKDNDLRNKLIDLGLKQSKKYSWGKSASKIIDIIKELSK